ncbi:MAG: molybdopterin molybdotransferase MoeA [Cyclobacteriaceae bacterium]
MINVAEARAIIAQHAQDFGTETISLNESIGRILREPISADRDMPPYDRVTMDGIAIKFSVFENGVKSFPVAGVAAAGAPKQMVEDSSTCIEVMTGAIMPDGVDTVIPYEKVEIDKGVATLHDEPINYQQNIHFQGLDRKRGDVVLQPGIQISSADVGVCATVGKAEVEVSKLPKTIVISSGDELVEINEQPLAHQIRKSNIYRIKTVLGHYDIPVETAHFQDDLEEIVTNLGKFVQQYDLIILSGGVSKGKFDYLPEALEKVGVEKLFHRIAQRPGKPFWFGKHPEGSVVFAFPGNPVSSFMCMQNYFKPWLSDSIQFNSQPQPYAKLTKDVAFTPDLTYYLEVKLDFNEKGEILANPIKGNGSGDLANLVDADAFIELPRGRDLFKAGEVYPIIRYRETSF